MSGGLFDACWNRRFGFARPQAASTVMAAQPTNLALDENVLTIQWSDGRTLVYDVAALRRHCPCATCRSERTRAGVAEEQPLPGAQDVTIRQMSPVGNYAYKISFSDGHDTGIYPLPLLAELGQQQANP